MMIRGFFTTFLMKQSLGRFGFGNAAFGSGLLVILFMVVNLDFSKQSYTFSMTCIHIYPGWYRQHICVSPAKLVWKITKNYRKLVGKITTII